MIESRLLILVYKHLKHFKEEDEMVTKTGIANPFLQNEMVLLPCLLDSNALIWYVLRAPYASTIKAPNLSCFVRAHTYIKHKR